MRRFNSILSSNAPQNPRNLALFGEWPIRYSKLGDIAQIQIWLCRLCDTGQIIRYKLGIPKEKLHEAWVGFLFHQGAELRQLGLYLQAAFVGFTKPHLPKFAPAMDKQNCRLVEGLNVVVFCWFLLR